jgi:hypothetical protein
MPNKRFRACFRRSLSLPKRRFGSACSPNEDFGKPKQHLRMRFPGKHFSTICSPNRVLTPLKSASLETHSERSTKGSSGLPKSSFGRGKVWTKDAIRISKHLSAVWVLYLGYEPLFCSSFQTLRLGSMQLTPPGLHATTKCAIFDTSCSVNTRFKIHTALFVVALLSNSQYDDDSMSMCLSNWQDDDVSVELTSWW